MRSTTSAAIIKCLDSHFVQYGVSVGSEVTSRSRVEEKFAAKPLLIDLTDPDTEWIERATRPREKTVYADTRNRAKR